MDHLVFLEKNSGDLGKILRGVKRMIVREVSSSEKLFAGVRSGDTLFFLRNDDDGVVRVKATVLNAYLFETDIEKDMSLRLKELQVNLQLTEPQYDYWVAKRQALFIEFEHVHKMPLTLIVLDKIPDESDWISTEDISSLISD